MQGIFMLIGSWPVPTPSQEVCFIYPAKLIYFSALAPVPSLKQHQFWLLSFRLWRLFEFTLLPLVRFSSLPPFFFWTHICRDAWDLVQRRLAWCSATGHASEEQSFLFISYMQTFGFYPRGNLSGCSEFIHSFVPIFLPTPSTHTQSYMSAMSVLFAVDLGVCCSYRAILGLSVVSFSSLWAHSWAGFLHPISGSLAWQQSWLLYLSDACGFLPVPPALVSGLALSEQHQRFHSLMQMPMLGQLAVLRKSHCPFVQS